MPTVKYFWHEWNFRYCLWLIRDALSSKNIRKQRPGIRPYMRFDSHILDRYAFRKTHIRLIAVSTSTNAGNRQIESILFLLPSDKLGIMFPAWLTTKS